MSTRDLGLLVMPHTRTASWPVYPDGPRLPVYSVGEALTRRYTTDAHTAAYAATPHARRLSTGALAKGVHPRMVLVVVDVDHHETHRLNGERAKKGLAAVAVPEAWRVDVDQRITRLRAEAPGIVAYHTRGGARLVGLLATPHDIADEAAALAWKVLYARTLARLSRLYGIVGDPACDDWTRLYRLPHATRRGSQVPEAWPVVGELAAVGVWPAPRAEELADDIAELRRLAAEAPKAWRSRLERVAFTARAPDGDGGPHGGPGRPMHAPRSRTVATPTVVGDVATINAAARAIAAAYVATVQGTADGNAARLAIIGALFMRGWSPRTVERTVAGVAAAVGDPADRWTSNVAVVNRRFTSGGAMYGEGYLREHARLIAEAIAQAASDVAAVEWRRVFDRAPNTAKHTPDEAAALVDEMLCHARRPGCRDLLVIGADTGTGKTHATCIHAVREALERGRRTAILAPSHTVARECVDRLRARGVKVAHLSGVLAHVNDEGAPTCRLYDQASELAEAGCDVRRVLCDGQWYGDPKGMKPKRKLPVVADQAHAPCVYRDACDAYRAHGAQAEELAAAEVVVAVHQLAHVAHAWLREKPDGALAVIDEAPELLAAARLTADELRRAAAAIGAQRSAVVRSEGWRAPLLAALAEGLARMTVDAPDARVSDLLASGLAVTELAPDEGERHEQVRRWAARCARRDTIAGEATGKARDRLAPRPAKRVVSALRAWRHEAEALAAVKVAGIVAAALAHEHGHAPRVAVAVGTREHGELAGVRELRLTGLVDHLAALLADQSIGRVVLDATTDPRILAQVVALVDDAGARVDGDRTTVAVERLAVCDAAPIARVFVPWAHGSRHYCLPDGAEGAIAWPELAGPMREGLALAAEGLVAGDRLAVFSWRPVAEALARAVVDPAQAPPELAEALAELRRRGVVLLTGYYGATRGRNDWRDAKGLLAVGTPWPDGAAVAQACAAVGLVDAARDVGAHLARAELEQVVGRLRAPRRSTPARLVVVASVPPLRADARYQVRELARGRPVAHDAAELAALAAVVGRNEAARITGASQGTVSAAVQAGRISDRRQDGVVNNTGHTPSVLPLSDHPILAPLAFPPWSPQAPDGDPPTVASVRCGGCAQAPPRASPRVATG